MGMAINAGGKGGSVQPHVNVTPLVDVALVVLIIFMVVTPMITKTFWLDIPKPAEGAPPPANPNDLPLVLTIDKAGIVRLNKQEVSRDELGAKLPGLLAATRGQVLHIDAADESPYGDVVDVIDRCRAAGASSIAVVTKHTE